ncbi:MAG: hypothetical protein II857_03535 [Selenomonadaceae bacterium]|nr:hypothetical protein [Selenomonadaceae bacterium]
MSVFGGAWCSTRFPRQVKVKSLRDGYADLDFGETRATRQNQRRKPAPPQPANARKMLSMEKKEKIKKSTLPYGWGAGLSVGD